MNKLINWIEARSQICWRVTRDTEIEKVFTKTHTWGKGHDPHAWYSYQGKNVCCVYAWKVNAKFGNLKLHLLQWYYIHLSAWVYGNVTWFHLQYPSDPQGKTRANWCVCVRVTYGVTTFQAVWAMLWVAGRRELVQWASVWGWAMGRRD